MRGKKQIISIIVAGLGLVGFIVVLCLVFFGPRGIDDNYFINSEYRIVSTMENPSSRLMYGAKRLHKVYEVNDNKITSYKIYYTYENSGAASEKFVEAKEKALEDYNVKEVTQNGKYIIVEMKSKTYEGIDPDEIRTMVQKLEQGLHYEPNQEEKTEPTEEDFLIDEEDEEE